MSMVIMALPTIALYEVSILAVQFVEKRQAKATPAS
jgi:sec-independent protein translocase protein TatC